MFRMMAVQYQTVLPKMKSLGVLVLALATLCRGYSIERGQRIVGGSATTIETHPYMAGMLHNYLGQLNYYMQWCGGTIMTQRTVLTAAHCFITDNVWHDPDMWMVRVGSTFASSGGQVAPVIAYVYHEAYDGLGGDVAVVQLGESIIYQSGTVAPGKIASNLYTLNDNEAVTAIGWGALYYSGPSSETLQEVTVWVVNQETCNERYEGLITDGMLCSGYLDVGGLDQCSGDSGGPLLHGDVVVGLCSFGRGCAESEWPGVNARVSAYYTWISNTVASLR